MVGFNPLDRGNLYPINNNENVFNPETVAEKFQSPRSGKFVSDYVIDHGITKITTCFNPLDRGNLYQMRSRI